VILKARHLEMLCIDLMEVTEEGGLNLLRRAVLWLKRQAFVSKDRNLSCHLST